MQLHAQVSSHSLFQLAGLKQQVILLVGVLAHLGTQVLELSTIGVIYIKCGYFHPVRIQDCNHPVKSRNLHYPIHAVFFHQLGHVSCKDRQMLDLEELDIVKHGTLREIADGGADVFQALQLEKQRI